MTKRIDSVRKNFAFEKKLSLENCIDEISKYASGEFSLKNGKTTPYSAKFDESVNIEFKLGVDLTIKSFIDLPNPSGKKRKILVIAADKEKMLNLGAAHAMDKDSISPDSLKNLSLKRYDVCVSTEILLRSIVSSGSSKLLGMKGLMPDTKRGTIFKDDTDMIASFDKIMHNRVEIKSDKFGYVRCSVGKINQDKNLLKENILCIFEKVKSLKPSSVKGIYMQKMMISSTLGFVCSVDFKNLNG